VGQKGRRWCGGWWGSDGWQWVWILESDWEGENGEGGGEGCTALLKNGGNDMNSDLKIGHVSPKTECVRMHISAFDRTRAEYICVKCALHSNVKVDVRTHLCNIVCVWWGAAVEHMKVSSYAALCTRSNIHDMFERTVQTKKKVFCFLFFFFFLQRYL
jgi:hypothetical protein